LQKKVQPVIISAVFNLIATVAILLGYMLMSAGTNNLVIFMGVAIILLIVDVALFIKQRRHLDWDSWAFFFVIYIGTLITNFYPNATFAVNVMVDILCIGYMIWLWRKYRSGKIKS
jgi:drug/metabolite transporter (DMT)-like permease